MSDPLPSSKPTPEGLFVTLDNLGYSYRSTQAPADRPHLFQYHLTIHNHSAKTVTILARKWILTYEDDEVDVIEGDKVIGKTPEIQPGGCFSYASFHLVGTNSLARGAFHGVDSDGLPFHVPIPDFAMTIPGDNACN